MLKVVDKTLVGLLPAVDIKARAEVSVTFSNIPDCFVSTIQLSVGNGTTTSDFNVKIPDGMMLHEIREKIQPEDAAVLPKVTCLVDGAVMFTHHISYIAKNIAFGNAAYSLRGVSDEILLKNKGTVDFNNPPLDVLWSAQQMLRTVLERSGAPITPVFFFDDFEVLHITEFYNVTYESMITDILSGMPIYVTFISGESGTKMYFVDVVHRARLHHDISGRLLTSMAASITYIPPAERSW